MPSLMRGQHKDASVSFYDGPVVVIVFGRGSYDHFLTQIGPLRSHPRAALEKEPRLPHPRRLSLLYALERTIFYSLQEGWSLVDALYFSVTTLTTVGLGDLAPTTTIGKLFTIIYIFSGLGLIAGFINTIATETLSRQRNEEDQEDTGTA